MRHRSLVTFVLGLLVSLLLVDAAAAYYSPNLGRWIKRDPIEETGGANLYGFACNQSINLFDPNGKIVIGIGGLIPFSGRSYLTKMGEGIAVQASRYIDSHFTSLQREKFVYIDGSAGIGVSKLTELAKEYRDRRFPNGKRDVCHIEGFVVLGYSDGGTTIYRFLQDHAEEALGLPDGRFLGMTYFGIIDMVRKDFGIHTDEWTKTGEYADRTLPLDHAYSFYGDVYYQDYDVSNLFVKDWKGYTSVGDYSSFRISASNHMDIIKDPVLHALVEIRAVGSYMAHIDMQLDIYRQYMATILRY